MILEGRLSPSLSVGHRAEAEAGPPWSGWLPKLLRQSLLRDVFTASLPSLVRWARNGRVGRRGRSRSQLANEWSHMIEGGAVRNRAELARRQGLSRSRVTQVLGPLPAR